MVTNDRRPYGIVFFCKENLKTSSRPLAGKLCKFARDEMITHMAQLRCGSCDPGKLRKSINGPSDSIGFKMSFEQVSLDESAGGSIRSSASAGVSPPKPHLRARARACRELRFGARDCLRACERTPRQLLRRSLHCHRRKPGLDAPL